MFDLAKNVILVSLFCIAAASTGTFFSNWRLRKINDARVEESFDSFIAYFSEKGIDNPLLRNAYYRVQEESGVSDFKVKPADRFYEEFGIIDEDLDDLVLELAKTYSCRTPTTENIAHCPLVTVEDLVYLLWELRLRNEAI